jgi:amidase
MDYVGWINTFEGTTGTRKERLYEIELVQELRAAAVVLFCKTSVPHTLHFADTIINIIGWTCNSANRTSAVGAAS